MAYQSWSVVYAEQPSTAKWNILGTNDASFNDGSGIGNGAIASEKLDMTVGFRAYRNAALSIAGATTVICDVEEFDYGADYNTTTGEFTVPVTGVYMVGFHIMLTAVNDGGAVVSVINKNGSGLLIDRNVTGAALTLSSQSHSLIALSAGDVLTTSADCTTTESVDTGTTDTYFYGYLLG